MVEKPCLFDNSKECPIWMVDGRKYGGLYINTFLEQACTICPIREQIMSEAKLAQRKKSLEETIKENLSS